jgi:hypothetical protein
MKSYNYPIRVYGGNASHAANTTNNKAVLLKPIHIPWMKTVSWKNNTFEQVRVSGTLDEPEPNIFATNKYLLDCCSYTRGEMSSRIGDCINNHVFELEINADGSLNTCDFVQVAPDMHSIHVAGITTHTSQDTFVHDGNGKYMKNNIIANILRNEIKYRAIGDAETDVGSAVDSSYNVVMRDGDPVLSKLLTTKYNTIIDGNISKIANNIGLRNILFNMVDYTSESMCIAGTLYDEIFMDAISGCNEQIDGNSFPTPCGNVCNVINSFQSDATDFEGCSFNEIVNGNKYSGTTKGIYEFPMTNDYTIFIHISIPVSYPSSHNKGSKFMPDGYMEYEYTYMIPVIFQTVSTSCNRTIGEKVKFGQQQTKENPPIVASVPTTISQYKNSVIADILKLSNGGK